jgi:SAM-dependent methyltransferase
MSRRKTYEPVLYQQGKDCPWEPMPYNIIDLMLKIGKITPNDVVMDLGSGDGRIPMAAANFGAFGIGVEYDHDLVIYSRNLSKKNGVDDKIRFIEEDFFNTDMSKASLITLFIWPHLMKKLYPDLLKLKPGTRIVSYYWSFDDGDQDWEPDFKLSLGGHKIIYLWIVPKYNKK